MGRTSFAGASTASISQTPNATLHKHAHHRQTACGKPPKREDTRRSPHATRKRHNATEVMNFLLAMSAYLQYCQTCSNDPGKENK
jgi:hypothetical protein